MKVIDFGDSVFRSLSNPDDISVPSICAWARFGINLGKLNNLTGKDYNVNENSLEILDSDGKEVGIGEAAIYEVIYCIDYYDRQARRFLGAGGIDVNFLQEASSDGGVLRWTSRNEVAKSFIQIKKDLKLELDKLINYYRLSKARGVSVEGDDLFVNYSSYRIGVNLPRIRDFTNEL